MTEDRPPDPEEEFRRYLEELAEEPGVDAEDFLRGVAPAAREETRRMVEDFHAHGGLRATRLTHSPEAGEELDDFRLLRPIASGGMGVVWEAEQRTLRRHVALKLLKPRYHYNERVLKRFLREARAGGRLAHPGIVQVYGYGGAAGQPYIATELVEGGRTLADLQKELAGADALPAGHDRRVAELVAEVADAMEHAHQADVVHRDLKPGNILLTADGRPKVADFGLAQDRQDLGLSLSGELFGTYRYLSPEQVAAAARGRGDGTDEEPAPGGARRGVGPRSDVFSLGATLYELLTLQHAFPGDTPELVMRGVEARDPLDPRRIRSRVPRDLAVICMKCLEKRPSARYASMAELRDDLRRFLADEPIHARPPGPLARAHKWTRRHPALSVAGAVGAVALVAISALAVQLGIEQRRLTDEQAKTEAALREARQSAGQLAMMLRSGLDVSEAAKWLQDRLPELADQELASLSREFIYERVFKDPLAQAMAAVKKMEANGEDPLPVTGSLQQFADAMLGVGLVAQALEPQEKAYELRKRSLAADDPDYLQSCFGMGVLLFQQPSRDVDGLKKAEELLDEAVSGMAAAETLGPTDPRTMVAMIALGWCLNEREDYDRAEAMLERGIAIARGIQASEKAPKAARDLASDMESRAISLLGTLHRALWMLAVERGQETEAAALLAEAVRYHEEALDRRQRLDDNWQLLSLVLLARLRIDQERLDDAEQLLHLAKEGGRQWFADDHWVRKGALIVEGHLLCRQYEEAGEDADPRLLARAEAILEDGERGMVAAFSDQHPYALEAKYYLGYLRMLQGRTADARRLLQAAFDGQTDLAVREPSAVAVPYRRALDRLD